MGNVVIGIDPDSKAHGVSVYRGGKLVRLECMTLLDVIDMLIDFWAEDVVAVAHMENVKGVSYSGFHYKQRESQSVKAKKSENVGMCKQAQTELERVFERYDVKVVHHKISKSWKKDKKQFELATGWKGRSNEDTRSAAYFGFLGCQ